MHGLIHRAIDVIRRRGIQITRMPPTLSRFPEGLLDITLAHVLADHLGRNPDQNFFFVQVGGFDGQDEMHELALRYDLGGIVVEPQDRYFKVLQDTYADCPRVTARQVAIGDRDGRRRLWRVAGPAVPAWTQELASFDVHTILQQDRSDNILKDNLVSEVIQCVGFETLLANVERVDLLLVDAEGYDAKLIETFDFARWRPSIVQFEHRHLSTGDHEAAIKRLVDHGYRVAAATMDTIGYRSERVERGGGSAIGAERSLYK